MTPNAANTYALLNTWFPYQLRFSIYNCRHISSSPLRPWSQHAASEPEYGYRSNALDVFAPPLVLDKVAQYLSENHDQLHVRTILWRVKNHYDHIHVDFWPKMRDRWYYRPPCKNGTLIVEYADGIRGDTFNEEAMIRPGDTGKAVSKIQRRLNRWRTANPLEVDGDYGPVTTARVQQFQSVNDLDNTGIMDGITYAELTRWSRNKVDA